MGIFKKKETIGEKALKIIAGVIGFEALSYSGGYTWERGKARATYDIRKNDPHYGYHQINFIVGVEEDDLSEDYEKGYNVDLEDAFNRLGKRIRNKRAVDEIDDDEDDDEEDIVDEEPPKIQPNKKG